MIEQKLIVGRFIDLQTLPPTNAAPVALGFQLVNRQVLHIAESSNTHAPVPVANPQHGFNPSFTQKAAILAQRAGQHIKSQFDRQRVSNTGVGAVTKVHRNFLWLEWLPGLVSEVVTNGMDVLTGPMSGCWIMSYQRGGVQHIGHVGTDMSHAHPNSVAARNAWNAFSAVLPPGSVTWFNPFNDPWVGGVPAQLPGEANRKTFALVTGAGIFHTVIAYPQVAIPTRIRIAGIQQNPTTLPLNGQI